MMQSERFTARVRLISTPASDNEEFGREDDEVAIHQEKGRDRRLFPSGIFLVSMAALGVALAFLWRNVEDLRWSNIQLWPTFSASPAQSTNNSESEQQIARLVQEVDALKKNVSELVAGQRQIAAGIASVQATQQAVYWHSNPAALIYPMAAAQRPRSLASPRQ
jgi:hypothetical protein